MEIFTLPRNNIKVVSGGENISVQTIENKDEGVSVYASRLLGEWTRKPVHSRFVQDYLEQTVDRRSG
ncbi:MAG: hypothetical protein ACU843_05730 [Gammaproteobacteria bacterium]